MSTWGRSLEWVEGFLILAILGNILYSIPAAGDLVSGGQFRRGLSEPRPACTPANMNFHDVAECESEFDQETLSRSPGVGGRLVCLGLSSYYGFTFSPVGRGSSKWIAKRVPVSPGPSGSVGCGGAVILDDLCTTLVATYEGPARNPDAVNRQMISVIGAPQRTFTLTGLSSIVYSGQGVLMTGNRAKGGSVSMVLEPSQFLNPSFPGEQWSGLVSLEFAPNVTGNNWAIPDDFATMKIFWLNTTVC
eukprot:jgi/Botrbrau1/16381/Bobra.85_2s0005.2